MRLARAKRVFYFMKRELWLHIGLYLAVGVDVLDDPRSLRSQNEPPSVAEMLGLREPSPVEKVPRNEADEVKINKI